MNTVPRILGVGGLLLAVACAPATVPAPRVTRLKADLLGSHSATEVLTQWCADLGLAAPAVIHAMRDHVDVPPSAQTRTLLKAMAGEAVHYRRVRLMCGSHVLSEADNWYVPARLTAQMNQILDTTDTSFGTVVRPLNFHRQTLEVLPVSGPRTILRVRALLLTPAEQPFSLVVENYTADLMAGPAGTR